MTGTSRIPAVLDALVAAFTTALAAADVTVTDGPPGLDQPLRELCIGHTREDDEIAFTQEWAGQGGLSRNEMFEIPNMLYLRTGDTNLSALRLALFGYLATIESTLRADPTLGITGFTVRAEFGTSGSYKQEVTERGLVLRVRFTIRVKTRI
jgi:hypothetical protein